MSEPRHVEVESPHRQALWNALFGPGFLLPGGEAELLRLVQPLRLAAESRLLVAGSGVVGPSASLARQLGVRVGGYDRLFATDDYAPGSPLVQLGRWDMAAETLPAAAFHHALLLHPLRDGAIEPVMSQVMAALRPAGHVMLLENVATTGFSACDETAAQWLRHVGRTHRPPLRTEIERALARLSLRVRAFEDRSDLQTRLAVHDWRRLVETMGSQVAPAVARLMLDEATGWSLRAKLIGQGSLRVMLRHAALPPGPRDPHSAM